MNRFPMPPAEFGGFIPQRDQAMTARQDAGIEAK